MRIMDLAMRWRVSQSPRPESEDIQRTPCLLLAQSRGETSLAQGEVYRPTTKLCLINCLVLLNVCFINV